MAYNWKISDITPDTASIVFFDALPHTPYPSSRRSIEANQVGDCTVEVSARMLKHPKNRSEAFTSEFLHSRVANYIRRALKGIPELSITVNVDDASQDDTELWFVGVRFYLCEEVPVTEEPQADEPEEES